MFILKIIDSVLFSELLTKNSEIVISNLKFFLNIPVKKIRTVVLVNRSHRMFPITVDFSGLENTTTLKEHIHVVLDSHHDVVYLS